LNNFIGKLANNTIKRQFQKRISEKTNEAPHKKPNHTSVFSDVKFVCEPNVVAVGLLSDDLSPSLSSVLSTLSSLSNVKVTTVNFITLGKPVLVQRYPQSPFPCCGEK
jgi:hypothetical protein